MDLVIHHGSLAPITSPENSLFRTPLHSKDSSFPIIAIAIIGILATAFLLVSYYIFVIKCCLNWHRIDLLRRFSLSRDRTHEEMLMAYSPGIETRGLDESVIRSIPVFHFKKQGTKPFSGKAITECAVCLNEFQDDEKLRIIPNCCHVFHIDCIDVWLQNNANCPLCRTSVSITSRFQIDQIIAPSSSPIDPSPYAGSLAGAEDDSNGGGGGGEDDDYVVIELSNENPTDQIQERLLEEVSARSISPSPPASGKSNKHSILKKGRKLEKGTSMGDECIDIIREKDEQFSIQPIRRSFSMDSSNDRKMFVAIQGAVQQLRQVNINVNVSSNELSPIEGCSSRVKRSFFSFGHGSRGSSRSAVLPVYLEP